MAVNCRWPVANQPKPRSPLETLNSRRPKQLFSRQIDPSHSVPLPPWFAFWCACAPAGLFAAAIDQTQQLHFRAGSLELVVHSCWLFGAVAVRANSLTSLMSHHRRLVAIGIHRLPEARSVTSQPPDKVGQQRRLRTGQLISDRIRCATRDYGGAASLGVLRQTRTGTDRKCGAKVCVCQGEAASSSLVSVKPERRGSSRLGLTLVLWRRAREPWRKQWK